MSRCKCRYGVHARIGVVAFIRTFSAVQGNGPERNFGYSDPFWQGGAGRARGLTRNPSSDHHGHLSREGLVLPTVSETDVPNTPRSTS